ncbi:MAG: LacI family DNA-binding transcriptional regulator [candidate division KSB1 bacterium]|nr:LacI family DNA-binding transcriptional regulator [candidate division KSB1 bacterium]
MSRPTIKQIAEMAKVSIATVDRVLHKRGKVKPETRQKIERIIKELDYQPNIFARNLVVGPSLKLAVLMPRPEQDGGYWKLPARGVEQASNNLKPFQVKVERFEYDKFSAESFIKVSNKVLENQYNGLLIAPIQIKAAKDFIETLPKKVPHVYFDSEIPNTRCLSTIHQNSFYGGRVAAKLFDWVIQDPSTIAMVRVLPATYHINERIRGFCDYFKSREDLNLIEVDVPENSKKIQVHEIYESILSKNRNLKGVFVTGSHTYEMADCISTVPVNRKIFLIGFDLVPANIEFMRSNVIDFLISQSPELQGFTGIYLLYRYLFFKEKVDKEITLPIEIITKENLDFYLNRQGLSPDYQSSPIV